MLRVVTIFWLSYFLLMCYFGWMKYLYFCSVVSQCYGPQPAVGYELFRDY